MATLTIPQAYQLAAAGGFTGRAGIEAVAIMAAESGLRTDATHTNANGSIDRGIWQINSVHNGSISPADQLDPVKATAYAYRLSAGGTNWSPWVAWTSGRADVDAVVAGLLGEGHSGFGDLVSDPVGAVTGVLGGSVEAVTSRAGLPNPLAGIDGVAQGVQAIAGFVGLLFRADTWKRIGLVAGGLALVGVGVAILNRDVLAGGATAAVTKNPAAGAEVANRLEPKGSNGPSGQVAGARPRRSSPKPPTPK